MIPQEYFNKMKNYFNGDVKKTYTWFETCNPALGFFKPLDMIKLGRSEKLKLFIDNSLSGNFP